MRVLRPLILAAALGLCGSASAHVTRHVTRHRATHRVTRAHRQVVDHAGRSIPLIATALRYLGARHSPSGFRGEWCGDFEGFVARRAGYRVPDGFRTARSWVHAGPRTFAHPGALMVMTHHVGIVLEAVGRRVLLLSGNHSHKVGIGWYSAARAIAFIQPKKES